MGSSEWLGEDESVAFLLEIHPRSIMAIGPDGSFAILEHFKARQVLLELS